MLVNIIIASWLGILLPFAFLEYGLTLINCVGLMFFTFVIGRVYQFTKQMEKD